jgi:hypothetical protein
LGPVCKTFGSTSKQTLFSMAVYSYWLRPVKMMRVCSYWPHFAQLMTVFLLAVPLCEGDDGVFLLAADPGEERLPQSAEGRGRRCRPGSDSQLIEKSLKEQCHEIFCFGSNGIPRGSGEIDL